MDEQKVLLFHLPQEMIAIHLGILSRPPFSVEAMTPAGELLHRLESTAYRLLILGLPEGGMTPKNVLPVIRGANAPCAHSILIVLPPASLVQEYRHYLDKGVNAVVSSSAACDALEVEIARQIQVAPRADARIMVRLKVKIQDQTTSHLCQTGNLSVSGMFLVLAHKPPVGSTLSFELMLPGLRLPVAGDARVARHASGGREKLDGVGVVFTDFKADGRTGLVRFVEGRLPGASK
jgi:hypothetical protein